MPSNRSPQSRGIPSTSTSERLAEALPVPNAFSLAQPGARAGLAVATTIAAIESRETDTSALVNRTPIAVQIALRLRAQILDRRYAPGERLNEVQIANEFGTSRGPVREGILRVAQDGLLELRPNRGAYVPNPQPDEVADLVEVRYFLDALAARLAASRVTSAAIDGLMAVQQSIVAWQQDHAEDPYPVGIDLHAAIARTTGNNYFTAIIETLGSRLGLVRGQARRDSSRTELANREHAEILRAIAQRDPDKAEAAMRQHDSSAAAFMVAPSAARAMTSPP